VLTEQDVRELINSRTENKNLDYKQAMNWGTAAAHEKGALVKDILDMTNTQDGGRIIFGVRDADFEVVGLTEEDFRSFDTTRLLDFVNRYADPPSAVGVSKFTVDGQRIVALDVPEFAEVPTICKADLNTPNNQAVLKRGATYMRTERASSESVSTADAMRDLMNRAVVKRGDQLLKMVERLIKGKPLELDEDAARQVDNEIQAGSQYLIENLLPEFAQSGRWETEFSVLPYVQERVPGFRAISEALQASQVTLRGWYFPHFDRENTTNFARGVQSFTSGRGILRRHLEGYRAYQSGVFVWKSEYWEDTEGRVPQGQKALSFIGVIFHITEFMLFAKRYYERLAPEASLQLRIKLTDTQGRYLISFGEGLLFENYTCREPEVEVLLKCTATELAASWEELSRKATRHVYELFNWNNATEDMIRQRQQNYLNQRV